MPNRNVEGNYRYGYQGEYAETDDETGKPAFELRLYDPRINRWMAPDPAKQYFSPYMSMGNNWVSRVDPDGGTDTDDWYEILDADGNGTGEYTWIDGNGYQEGYEHVGFFMNFTDVDGNNTFYDGVTQASYYNGKPLEYFGGQLDEVLVTADIRSFGQKAEDWTRGKVNSGVRTYTKFNTIITRQLNVVIEEGVHPGRAYSYDSYKGWHNYQEYDENWNLIDIPLYKSDDLETALDVITITPTGIQTGLGTGAVQKFVINQATSGTIKAGIKKGVQEVHSRVNE